MRTARRTVALLLVLALLVKIPTFGTAAFWDETAWLGQAGWLANAGLVKVLPGLRPDAQFFGHPPGLHFAAAALFKVLGRSIEVAHVLIACLGAVGVGATYALVRWGYDTRTALLAALLLLFSPAWFSSAGVFLADLPVAALGALSAVFVLRGRMLAYLVTASCMVLIKETAVALVVALVAFRALTRLPLTRATMKDALPYAAPLLVFAAFVVVQKVATGRFFYIYDFETDALFDVGIRSSLRQAAMISHWILVAQFRWVLTGAIVLNLLTSPEARRRRELLLFALVTMASGYAFSVLFYMPRYVLPVLPFFHALGAVSLMALARTPLRQAAAGAVVMSLTLWSLARDPYRGHGEDNLQYLGIVRAHQDAAREVETRYREARIVSAWPTAAELSDPLLGYVTSPFRVTWFADDRDLAEADIAVVSRPANDRAAEFERLLQGSGWPAVFTRSHSGTAITIYRKPSSVSTPPRPGR